MMRSFQTVGSFVVHSLYHKAPQNSPFHFGSSVLGVIVGAEAFDQALDGALLLRCQFPYYS